MTDTSSYLLLDRLAAGGMAEIYRAKSLGVEGFERIVAIKRILPSLASDAEFVEMFIQEAKVAGQLSHANIVPILELGKIGGTHFIAMEYVWGKDLRKIIARFRHIGQPMPPPMAAWIMSKVLEALDHAHRKRGVDGRPLAIIHRDVSPQNVLVSYDGLVKLIDFGIAKAASRASQTQAGVIKGKLAYMSPEQIMGMPLDHRSDVFAASSVLHELLTGEPLFKGVSDIDVIDKVREARAAPPSATAPHVSQELDAIVMKGLARDVAQRYQTAGEMQEAVMRFIVSSRPPYSTSELGKWMRVAFAPEIAKERAHLEQLSSVAQAGAAVSQGVPAAAPRAGAPAADDDIEELSQIVMVEELSFENSAPSHAAHATPIAPAPRDLAPAAPEGALDPRWSPPGSGMTEQAPVAPPSHPNPQPTPSPVSPPHGAPSALPASESVRPAFQPPRIAPRALAPQPAPAPVAAAPKRGGAMLLAALVVLLLGAGGAAAWFFLLGGRAILGL